MFKRNILKNLATLCLALILPLAIAGQSTTVQPSLTKSLPIETGEELIYQAEFSRSLLRGLDVGEFKFTSSRGESKTAAGTPVGVLNLTGDIVSKGFFIRLFGVRFHEQIESIVDQSNLTVLHTKIRDEQNKRVRTSDAVFDHEAHKVTWTEQDPNDAARPARVVSGDFTEPVQDVLSGIFFIRTRSLEVGKPFELIVSDSGRVVHVPVAVRERKRMKTVLGQVYALRLEPAIFGAGGEGGLVRGDGRLSIWVTDDNRHIPVRAQIKVEAGTFEIKLKRYRVTPR